LVAAFPGLELEGASADGCLEDIPGGARGLQVLLRLNGKGAKRDLRWHGRVRNAERELDRELVDGLDGLELTAVVAVGASTLRPS